MNIPQNLRYTSDHEWIKQEGDLLLIGITDHAQDSLGDVTFVELPNPGTHFDAKNVFGVVESVKAASDLYMPVSGEVVEINDELDDSPDRVNSDQRRAARS
jgi:glycine cleavage system H protein